MKKIKSFILILLGLIFISSCEDDKNMAVLNTTDAVPAELVTPADESVYALDIALADSNFESFTWIAADYGAIVPRSYRLEMDMGSGDFSDPENLISTSELTFEMTNAALNLMMFDFGLLSNLAHDLHFRVKTTVANAVADTLISKTNIVALTPFSYLSSQITSPEDGSSHVLVKEDADIEFEMFEWTAAEYGSEYDILYIVELDKGEGGFSDPVELARAEVASFQINVSELNQILLDMGLEAGVVAELELRVTSRISVKSGILHGDITKINVTPYSDVVSEIDPNLIYLLGGATSAGVENGENMIPAYYLESSGTDSIFAVCDELTPAGIGSSDGTFMFVKSIGSYFPQWGSDGAGTWDTGSLVLKSTIDDPDPQGISAPDVQSDYLIKANVVSLTYSVEEIATTMHIIGDATDAQWDNTIAIAMTKIAPGKFSLIANLDAAAGEGFKFLVNQGQWAPMYGQDGNGTSTEGVLSYRATEADADPSSIPPPEVSGSYLIEVDLASNKYSVTLQ